MASGFHYLSGPYELDSTRPTTASTQISVEDALKSSSGQLLPATAGTKVVATALDAKSSSSSATTGILTLTANSNRTKFLAYPKNSSSLAAADANGQFDLSGTTGAMGFDRAATGNGDVTVNRVLKTGTSGIAVIMFSDPFGLSST